MTNPEATQLLVDRANGNHAALDRLLPLLYDDLRQLAARYMRQERPDHTLQATALVNQLYLRLIDQQRIDWRGRAHFFALCAQLMRRILIDHARKHLSEKGKGSVKPLPLDEALVYAPEHAAEFVALHEALDQLAQADERSAQVVEMRFFGGMSNEEIAEVLGISANTVINDWNFARAWLRDRLEAGGDGGESRTVAAG